MVLVLVILGFFSFFGKAARPSRSGREGDTPSGLPVASPHSANRSSSCDKFPCDVVVAYGVNPTVERLVFIFCVWYLGCDTVLSQPSRSCDHFTLRLKLCRYLPPGSAGETPHPSPIGDTFPSRGRLRVRPMFRRNHRGDGRGIATSFD